MSWVSIVYALLQFCLSSLFFLCLFFSRLTDEGEKETDEDSVKKSDLTDAASFFDREKKMRKITALALL